MRYTEAIVFFYQFGRKWWCSNHKNWIGYPLKLSNWSKEKTCMCTQVPLPMIPMKGGSMMSDYSL